MQAAEIAFATGQHLRFPYEAVQVGEMVGHDRAGRVTFHGYGDIAPGITAHRSTAKPSACRRCASPQNAVTW